MCPRIYSSKEQKLQLPPLLPLISMLIHHNLYVCLFSLISSYVGDSYHGGLSSPSVTLMDIVCLKSGVSYCFPCSLLICGKQLPVYLTHIWTASNWKGRSEAGGDFVLCSLASFPPANWPLKTTFEKTEFLHRVWDDIIVLLLHNPGHAIKIAFIHWILSMGRALRQVLYTHPVTTTLRSSYECSHFTNERTKSRSG